MLPFSPSHVHVLVSVFVPLLNTIFPLRPIRADNGATLPDAKCQRPGDRFVQDFIQYECAIGSSSSDDAGGDGRVERGRGGEVSFDPGNNILRVGGRVPLVGKPVGCVPSNKADGTAIRAGMSHTTKHFRYECVDDESTVALKITHCVDHDGKLVRVGEFYTHPEETNSDQFTSVECVGNEFLAKKIIHKWSNCLLADGKKLVEGDFTVQDFPRNSMRSQLQKLEIVACLHEEGNVRLKCTGCVATNGQELAVTRFANVAGQWTQCRRFREGCRLINVTQDYIDCEIEGTSHKHGSTFESATSKSLFICSHGQIIKQGCFIQGRELTLVGDVKYVDGVTPALCVDNDNFTFFNGIVGCDLPDGRFKRFMEVWRDGDVMKRCSWAFNSDGSIARSEISTYACLDGLEVIPLNKVIQKDGGRRYVKCARMDAAPSSDEGSAGDGVHNSGTFGWRNLTESEFVELTTKKLARQNLMEYFGVGRRASPLLAPAPPNAFGGKAKTQSECVDLLPFCPRLSGYCPFMNGPLERGLALESFSELRELQARFEQFGGRGEPLSLPVGCEKQPSTFQKLQLLIELACQQTCQKCSNVSEKESALAHLENTSHCG
uniref:Abnormal cell migration protein 18-like fibronectin type I domain-containing protein n=1 Tax=Globodera rostochiensis TaxID=31243 RepID=A0A914HD59_GLORO